MPNDYEQLKNQVQELQRIVSELQRANQITPEFEQVLRRRIKIVTSSKGADSEDVVVDEAGTATHRVLSDPIGFLAVTYDGVTYQVPYYNA